MKYSQHEGSFQTSQPAKRIVNTVSWCNAHLRPTVTKVYPEFRAVNTYSNPRRGVVSSLHSPPSPVPTTKLHKMKSLPVYTPCQLLCEDHLRLLEEQKTTTKGLKWGLNEKKGFSFQPDDHKGKTLRTRCTTTSTKPRESKRVIHLGPQKDVTYFSRARDIRLSREFESWTVRS